MDILSDFPLLYILKRRRKRMRNRSQYIRNIFRRRNFGEMNLVRELSEDSVYHHRYFRMDKTNYLYLLDLIRPFIKSNGGTHLLPISVEEKFAISLRYLASGNSQISMGMSYRISQPAISSLLREVLYAIYQALKGEYLKNSAIINWKEEAQKFYSMWQFPNCLGAWDGKHIRIRAPGNTGSDFYNYKQFFSIVLLASVSADYKFQIVDIGTQGSLSDSHVMESSVIGRQILDGTFNTPPPISVPGAPTTVLPHVFIGDGGFSLKSQLMRPYTRDPTLGKEKRIFNYRLSRARRVSENAFGILAARWRIFQSSINSDLDLAMLIVQSTIVLHNFLMSKRDFNCITTDSESNGELVPGNWRGHSNQFKDLCANRSNNYTKSASSIRNDFATYFSSTVGSVSWQESVVSRGNN